MALTGSASASATERFRARSAGSHPSHFRLLKDLWVSSIGLGSYLGNSDADTDALYSRAVELAVTRGCNVLDTAFNYRCQRSERSIADALKSLTKRGLVSRDELIVCTKGGYLAFDGTVPANAASHLIENVLRRNLAQPDEIVAGCHCLSPKYLEFALHSSLANLHLETIDIYYLHNPEQQLDEINREMFLKRMEAAFGFLESQVQQNRIRRYGIATWHGLRSNPAAKHFIDLDEIVGLARKVAGEQHHFEVIQLPYNLAMPEAFSFTNQTVGDRPISVLEAAQELGLSVIVSASLLQSKLAMVPSALRDHIPGLNTPAQRSLQFARSTKGVTTALVGMKQRAHVEENVKLAQLPLLEESQIAALFDRSHR